MPIKRLSDLRRILFNGKKQLNSCDNLAFVYYYSLWTGALDSDHGLKLETHRYYFRSYPGTFQVLAEFLIIKLSHIYLQYPQKNLTTKLGRHETSIDHQKCYIFLIQVAAFLLDFRVRKTIPLRTKYCIKH